jgi:tetratricopeptide (TPR) repeat protein
MKDAKAFAAWLATLLDEARADPSLARRMRYATHVEDEAPFAGLVKQRGRAVQVIHGQYHMQAVPRELVAESGERGPGGQFRRLFVELSETLALDDPARLARLRGAALSVAQKAQWFDQCVVVDLLAGSAYLKWRDYGNALAAYRGAFASSAKAIEAGQPAGDKLAANALFGEASVHLMRNEPLKAVPCYERAAAHCRAAQDAILTVEAWRMHAWCLDRARWREPAIDSGFRALAAAQGIDAPLRARTSASVVAQWMLERVGLLHERRDALAAQLHALFGPRWREILSVPCGVKEAEPLGVSSAQAEPQ